MAFQSFLVKKSRGKSMFGGVKASWQEREFTLYSSKKLVYADKDIIKGEIDITGATARARTAKEVGGSDDVLKFYFEIITDSETLVLAADAGWRRDKWIEQITSVVNGTWVDDAPAIPVSKLPPPGEAHTTDPAIKARLEAYAAIDGNTECADCSSALPSWASVNNGVIICTACSGVHRSLGVHISFVQSLNMDYWSEEGLVAFMSKGPNAAVNAQTLEYHVPEGVFKASPNCTREERERWIRLKYVDRAFVQQIDEETGEPSNERREPIMQEDPSMSVFASHAAGTERDDPQTRVARSEECAGSRKSVGEKEFIGVLMIKLIKASNLVKVDTFGKNDVYVKAACEPQCVDSKVIPKTLNPIFDQTLMLSWDGISPVVLSVMAVTNKKGKDVLGTIRIDVGTEENKTILEAGDALTIVEQPLDAAKSGTISVEISFTSLL